MVRDIKIRYAFYSNNYREILTSREKPAVNQFVDHGREKVGG